MVRSLVSPRMARLWTTFLLFTGTAMAEQPDRAGIEFFENKIRPVLVERCYKCHSDAKKQSKGGLKLDSREQLLKGGEKGPAVIPGNPDRSLIIKAIRRTDQELAMPPKEDDQLTPTQIQDLVAWVKMGLPYPADSTTKPAIDLAEARKFWSFQPLKEAPLPKVKQAEWPQGSIDRFVLAKLEDKGMKPSLPADKRTLLRRATFDLTGLPPTPQEMDAFLADTTRNAYAKVVERLLASPQYGVKWGRHWLDVARYGDTRWVGAGEDRRWPFAYTYRDWVIQALNDDMPYDRFVTLQLAADQTPGATGADQAALGFLTVGRWFTGNLHDVIDDQIDVVTRGFLGMSAQCSRCHDHKFDPIPTADYYSLYGLFAASRMPVEGMGLLVELPEVAPRPIAAALEKELTGFRSEHDQFLTERLTAVRKEFRSPAKMQEYMLAAESLVKKTDNELRALAKSQGLNESLMYRWVRYLQRSVKEPHPIFGPWHAFAALPESEFAMKAGSIVEQEKARKPLNPHIAAILTPTPTSLADLAKRYVQLFLKFDAPEQSTDNDQEALRQVLQSNDGPVQISRNEVGNYLSKDEKDRVLNMRRALLTKLAPLSESADHFLAYQNEATATLTEVNEFLQKRRTTVMAEIRSVAKIADYLIAARDAQGADEYRFKSIVNSRKLSDRLLRRWIAFVQSHADRNDPVFAIWRAYAAIPDKEFAEKAGAVTAEVTKSPRHMSVGAAFAKAPASLRDVATTYGELIAKFNKTTPFTDHEEESLRQVSVVRDSPLSFDEDGVLDYFTRKDFDELRNQENKLARLYLDHPGAAPRAMLLRESPRPYAQKVFTRGNPDLLGMESPGRFFAVLSNERQQLFQKGKGRLELAQSIVDPTNPLTARVMVNRAWQWHFGTGLISTASDLGTRGEKPTHPELLDTLARQFVADGWSVKKLHQQIMLSATYQQSSTDNPMYRATDPENRLLWRMSRRRLTFEEFRDSILATSGRLDETLGGRSFDLTRAGSERRTIFGIVDRMNLPGFYRNFDFPSSDAHTPERHETLIPQQALFLMNSAFIMDRATDLAGRTASQTPTERVTAMYKLVYSRAPSAAELALGLEFTATAANVPEEPGADPWQYGYGRFSEKLGQLTDFKPFPFFNGQWRGGAQENDSFLGRMSLHGQGGNAGPNGNLAVIRRWIAPRAGKVSITGTLSYQKDSIQPSGDGVRGRLVSSKKGQLGVWLVHGTEETTNITSLEVQPGDTIAFVVDGRGRDNSAGFAWAPVIRMDDPNAGKDTKVLWDAAKEFKGAPVTAKPADVWSRYAQVLLEANEFFFLD